MTTYDPNNVFAKILRGDIPCTPVYQDEHTFAFHDIHPQAPVHILVIPRGPYASLTEFTQQASADEIAGFYRGFGAVIEKLGIAAGGYRTIANSGANGGQEVPHFHLHILAGRVLGPMLGRDVRL